MTTLNTASSPSSPTGLPDATHRETVRLADSAGGFRGLVTTAPLSVPVKKDAGRSCGPCGVCCRLPDIPELDKPIDTWCPHARPGQPGGTCSIYENRPGVCRSFECAWKQGLGGEYDRPDILGVMWQTVTMPDGGPGLGVIEARPGALSSPRVRAQLRTFEARQPGRIVVRRAAEPRFSSVAVLIEGKPIRKTAPRASG